MLPIPASEKNITCIVGIDPGSTKLGVSIIYFDILTLELISCESYTFDANKLNGLDWLTLSHTDRVHRLFKHKENLLNIFRRCNPICVTVESPFINMKRPQAFGALTEVFFCIRQAVIEYDVWCGFYSVEPSNVKRAVGAMGNADKQAVKSALIQINELMNKSVQPLDTLDEHSIDALAVAYFQYKKYNGEI